MFFAQVLRDHDVEVLYLTELLTEAFASELARDSAIQGALASLRLGQVLSDSPARAHGRACPGSPHRVADRGPAQ
ncbi:MAG: arginine deiminase family protein [Marmoricola sp.]